jgi:hypothetical protein
LVYSIFLAKELLIVIDPSNIEHFFSEFGHKVLVELKRIANDDNLELELEENDELGLESEPEEDDELESEPEEDDELESEPEEDDELGLEPEEKELKRIADNDEPEVRYYKSLLINCGLSFVK